MPLIATVSWCKPVNECQRGDRKCLAHTVVEDEPGKRNDAVKADKVDRTKRRLLTAATTVVGGAGLAMATVPFIRSMSPSARSRAASAPVKMNVSKLPPGQQLTVEWRGMPVWVLHRSAEMLAGLENKLLLEQLRDPYSTQETRQPAYAQNVYRSIKPEYLVVIGVCTHLYCVPTLRLEAAAADRGGDWSGGYICSCHGSRFDLAGRVYKGVPAPSNLMVPPHRYLDERVIECGAHPVSKVKESGADAACCLQHAEAIGKQSERTS